jgi:hypothetical protein
VKRGKESSSDEDGGGGGSDKGSGVEEEEQKATAPDGSSGDDDYRQVKSKRQKLKEKKKRQKAKKAEAVLGRHERSPVASLLLPDESERERRWLLDSLQPSPEAVDQALAGHPAAHPLLLRLLMTADSLFSSCTELGPDPTFVHTLLRRLVLSSSPLTSTAVQAAVTDHMQAAV